MTASRDRRRWHHSRRRCRHRAAGRDRRRHLRGGPCSPARAICSSAGSSAESRRPGSQNDDACGGRPSAGTVTLRHTYSCPRRAWWRRRRRRRQPRRVRRQRGVDGGNCGAPAPGGRCGRRRVGRRWARIGRRAEHGKERDECGHKRQEEQNSNDDPAPDGNGLRARLSWPPPGFNAWFALGRRAVAQHVEKVGWQPRTRVDGRHRRQGQRRADGGAKHGW